MDEQATVEMFAQLAKPRLMDLLKLKVRHLYDPAPGNAGSTVLAGDRKIGLQLHTTSQPYRDIQRFAAEDKVMGYVVNPGLLPIAKAIALDIRGRRLLVTRKPESKAGEEGVAAYVDGFGVRVRMYFDSDANDTLVVWECLYGVG